MSYYYSVSSTIKKFYELFLRANGKNQTRKTSTKETEIHFFKVLISFKTTAQPFIHECVLLSHSL